MASFLMGLGLGFFLCIAFTVAEMDGVTRDECRAAHAGYDCILGWVRGEAF